MTFIWKMSVSPYILLTLDFRVSGLSIFRSIPKSLCNFDYAITISRALVEINDGYSL